MNGFAYFNLEIVLCQVPMYAKLFYTAAVDTRRASFWTVPSNITASFVLPVVKYTFSCP